MKKEEILEKSRSEKHDEGVEIIRSKMLKVTSTIVLLTLLIVFISNFITGKQNYLASTIAWTFFAGNMFFIYKTQGKKKINLLGFILSLIMVILYMKEYLGELF